MKLQSYTIKKIDPKKGTITIEFKFDSKFELPVFVKGKKSTVSTDTLLKEIHLESSKSVFEEQVDTEGKKKQVERIEKTNLFDVKNAKELDGQIRTFADAFIKGKELEASMEQQHTPSNEVEKMVGKKQ